MVAKRRLSATISFRCWIKKRLSVPKSPGDRIGTGEACLVYQSGQEIGLVQEGLVRCTKVARR